MTRFIDDGHRAKQKVSEWENGLWQIEQKIGQQENLALILIDSSRYDSTPRQLATLPNGLNRVGMAKKNLLLNFGNYSEENRFM